MILPQYNKNKEYESPLHEYRVDLGYTVLKLCALARIGKREIKGFAEGSMSPLYIRGPKRGTIKPCVERLSVVLKTPFEDLFPRYFCSLVTQNYVTDQILICSHSDIELPADEQMILLEKLSILDFLKPRHKEILLKRLSGQRQSSIARELGFSREFISGIERNAIKRIKKLQKELA